MLIKTVKLHQAPGIHRFECKTSLKLKYCNLVHIFYMDSLDNLDIFCPYELCCSFSNHEKSSHNTVLDKFGHAYLCDSHTSQKLQHKHTFFVKCEAQVYHRKPGRKDGRTEGRKAENYVPPLFFEKAGDNNQVQYKIMHSRNRLLQNMKMTGRILASLKARNEGMFKYRRSK